MGGSRDYVLKRLEKRNIKRDQFWRAKFNGSGIEYMCPGPDHSPDIRNCLKLLAVEEALEEAYSGVADTGEIAAFEKEHVRLLAPILLHSQRSQHGGSLKKNSEGHTKKAIRQIATHIGVPIEKLSADHIFEAMANAELMADLFGSSSDPLAIEITGIDEVSKEVACTVHRTGKSYTLTLGNLRNVVAQLRLADESSR